MSRTRSGSCCDQRPARRLETSSCAFEINFSRLMVRKSTLPALEINIW